MYLTALGFICVVVRHQVLPAGASKGVGVAALLAHLGISPTHLMALGDGENDVEMLQVP